MIQTLAATAVTKPATVLLLSHTSKLTEQIAQIAADAHSGHLVYPAFQLKVARTWQTAITAAEKDEIDLVIWDTAVLPDLAAQTVASLSQLVPVIAIVEEDSQAATAVAAGANDFFLHTELTKNNFLRLINYWRSKVEQNQLLRQEKEQHELAELLREIANNLHRTLDVEQLLDQLLLQIERLVPYDMANVVMIEQGRTRMVYLRGYEEHADLVNYRFSLAESETYGRVAATKQPLLISDTSQYPGWDHITEDIRSWLCVPILQKGELIAMLALDKFQTNFYQPGHVEKLVTITKELEAALEQAHLYQALQRQLAELTVLHSVAVSSAGTLNEDDLIEQISAIIGDTLYPSNFGILLLDESSEQLRTHPTYIMGPDAAPLQSVSLSQGIVGHAARTRQPYICPDVTQDPHYLEGQPSTRSEIAVPFENDGRLLGVINVESPEFAAFSENDQRFLVTLANYLGNNIVKIRLFAAEQRRRHEAEVLHRAAVALGSTLNLDSLLNTLLDYLGELIPFDSASVMMVENDRFVVRAGRGHEKWTGQPVIGLAFSLNIHQLLHKMMAEKQMVIVPDTQTEPLWEGHETTRYIRNWLGVPLVVGGEIIGCYGLDKAEPYYFTEEHFRIAEALAVQTAVAIQNSKLYQAAQQYAHNQELTSTILQDLNATPEVYEVFPRISATLKQLSACGRVTLTLLNDDLKSASNFNLDLSMRKRIGESWFLISDSAAIDDVLNGRIHATPDLAPEQEKYPNSRKLYQMGYRSTVNIPLHSGKQIVGSLNLSWPKTNGYNTDHFPLFKQTADAIALALERSKLFDAIKQWAHQLTILHELGRRITGIVETKQLAQIAAKHLQTSLRYENILVFLVDQTQKQFILEAGTLAAADVQPLIETPPALDAGLLGAAYRKKRPLRINDTTEEQTPSALSYGQSQSELVLPLQAGEHVIGLLYVGSLEREAFTETDVAILTIVADQLAVSLENARLFSETRTHAQELEQRNQELEAIYRLNQALASTLDIQEVYRILFHEIVQNVLDSPHFTIARLDEKAQLFYCEFSIVDTQETPPENFPPMPLGDGPMSETALSRKGQIINFEEVLPQLEEDGRVVQIGDERRPKSGICVPLISGDRTLGVMFIQHYKAHAYSEADLTLLSLLANQASMAIENAQLYRQAQQHADELERRVAERTRELAAANERLQELDRLKSKFVADVSHELRTPITNLSLYLDLIEQGKPEKQKEYITTLRQQVNRLGHLIEDTLNLSRIELGRGRVTFHSFALNDVVEPVVAAHLPSIEAAGLVLTTDLAPDLPKLYGERNQVAQVVTNLLSNAINYTPSGSIHVATVWDAQAEEVCLVIADSGIGIDQAEAPLLFDRFYRGRQVSQSNIPGTGLGLAIVKEIVDLHAGTIEVDGRPGKGTIFTVRFPIYAP